MRDGLLLLAFTAVVLWGPAEGRADDGERALSLSAGYASFSIDEQEALGGALGVELELGVGDSLWLRAAAAGAVYAADPEAVYGGQASLGLTYVVDVLKYVPYLHAGIGGAMLAGGELEVQGHPLVELGAGVDLLARRDLSYGIYARIALFLDDSAFVGAGLRITRRWGFF